MGTSIGDSNFSNYLDGPLLSVVLATPGRFDTIRKTVHCLLAQSIKDRIELLIVTPSHRCLEVEQNDVADFLGYKVVEIPGMNSIGAAGVKTGLFWFGVC